MSPLANLKGQRTRLTKKINHTIEAARKVLSSSITDDEIDDIQEEIDINIENCKDLSSRFETISTKIVEALQDKEDKELEAEGEISTDVLLELSDTVSRLTSRQRKICRKQQSSQVEPPDIADLTGQVKTLLRRESMQDSVSFRPGGSVNLPKLDFDCFAGDILRWSEFWDSFAAAIHHNLNLHDVQKLAYLRAKLRGEAKSVIAGLETTNENYEVAIGLLKQRFGNQQAAISAHYSKLMDLQAVPNETSKLRALTDSVEQELRCLSSLGEDVNHRHFISLMMHKLPEDVITKLEEMKGPEEDWTVEGLRNKLQTHLIAREAASRHNSQLARASRSSDDQQKQVDVRRQNSKVEWRRYSHGHNGRSTTEMLYNNDNAAGRQYNSGNNSFGKQRYEHNNANNRTKTGQSVSIRCVFCTGKHWSDECQRYRTVSQRKQQLPDRCFNCLRSNHKTDMCRSMKPCFHCKSVKQHHTSLCPVKFPFQKETSHVANEMTEATTTDESLLASGERAILQTAIVDAFSPSSKQHAKLRLLFDSGSHRSYISEEAATMLQLRPKATETIAVNTFAEKKSKNVQTKIVDIQLKTHDNFFAAITANVVPTISASIQRLPIDLARYNNLLKDIRIADPVPLKPEQGSIDILIGSDYYMDLLTFERKPLGDHLYLLGSKFGWILAGRSKKVTKSTIDYSMLILYHNNQSVPELNQYKQPDKSLPLDVNTEDFWKLETIGIKESNNDITDEHAISQFNTTVKQVDGRYFVKWPWKEEFPRLPTIFHLSMGRLKSLLRRLSTNGQMFKKYNGIIEDQLSKGVIEKVVGTSRNESIVHYIPHQAVVKPDKSTTKVRIVYDASAKVNKNVPSLNECLLRGPVILENLCGLLMRFRLHKYAVVADIEKAFLQIGLKEEDRDVVRFLWIKDPERITTENNLQIFRFARVPFGAISSPFLLAATVQFHLNNAGTVVSKQLSRDIYVDNIITGESCEEGLLQLYVEGKDLFKRASMNLREWASNSKKFSESIATNDVCKDKTPKVLGLYWNTNDDSLSLPKVRCEVDDLAITKRTVFKKIAQFFDPLGQFTPVTIRAKMYIQELWSEKISWDERLSQEMKAKWIEMLADLKHLNQLKIPRYIGMPSKAGIEYNLVGFCDASNNAYAAVIYLHQKSNGEMKTTMIFSKSRLAPLKRETIPRLELLAVLIGVRAIKFVEKHLRLKIKSKSIWSDSKCVLHWIKSSRFQPTFIQNRLIEIKIHTDVTFNYVKSEDNPADIPSRGMSAANIETCDLWWKGPYWLKNDLVDWPKVEIEAKREADEDADRSKVLFEASMQAKEDERDVISSAPFGINISKFSSILRLQRVTAWVIRFLQRARGSRQNTSTYLTSSEIKAAKQNWEKSIQSDNFPNEIKAINDRKKNNLVRKFNLYLDDQGLIRCSGRIVNSNFPIETKFPKLLPKNNKYTNLVIENVHRKLLHAGVSQTLAELRREYWLPQGRNQVRKILTKCTTCRKWEGGPFQMPQSPALPNCRVARTTPFSYTGVDYFGPLYTKSKNTTNKTWVCLFTCLTVRAIHLESVHELSADQFIMALRRFISRRGTPVQMFSDNGTNFKAATKTVSEVLHNVSQNDDIQDYTSTIGIRDATGSLISDPVTQGPSCRSDPETQ